MNDIRPTALIAEDEFVFNAEMLGMQMALVRAEAATPEEAVAAAHAIPDFVDFS